MIESAQTPFEKNNRLEGLRSGLDRLMLESMDESGRSSEEMRMAGAFDVLDEHVGELAEYFAGAIRKTTGKERYNYIVSYRQLRAFGPYLKSALDFDSLIGKDELEALWQSSLAEIKTSIAQN